jgi:hypothetical protein
MVMVLPECFTTDGTTDEMVGALYEKLAVSEFTRLLTVTKTVLSIPVPLDGRKVREACSELLLITVPLESPTLTAAGSF